MQQYRLVTVVGAGGVGKTRLAIELARVVEQDYAGGAWLVQLAPIEAPELLHDGVARAIGVDHGPERSARDSIVSRLTDGRCLVVLDNCEHLLEMTAALAADLLDACPGLTIIATSRERLNISGECVWRLQPLPTPRRGEVPPRDDLLGFDAARLFVERAAAPLALTPDDCASIADITARLDGLPLAIELAASRLNVLSARQIAERLDDRFSLLTVARRGDAARHQTLRAVIAWSDHLLGDDERQLFRRLSAFAGSFTLKAAEDVCGEPGDGPSAILNGIASLVDKSMLVADQDSGRVRYRLLETMREYALEMLDRTEETTRARARHAAWALRFAENATSALDGPHQGLWLSHLDQERDNMRAALEWFAETRDDESLLRLAIALAPFWWIRGPVSDGRRWMELALARNDKKSPTRLRGLSEGARLAYGDGDVGQTWSLGEQALLLAAELGNEGLAAIAVYGMAIAADARGDVGTARDLKAKALALARQTGDPPALILALISRAMGHSDVGDFSAAQADLDEARGVAAASGNPRLQMMVIARLGELADDQSRHEEACRLLKEYTQLAGELGDEREMATGCFALGRAATLLGDLGAAQRSFDDGLLAARQRGDDAIAALNLWGAAELAIVEERADLAETRARQALRLALRAGDHRQVPSFLVTLAHAAAERVQYERAARLLGAADILRERMRGLIRHAEKPRYERILQTVREGLDEIGFEIAWAAGRTLSEDDAVRCALEAESNEAEAGTPRSPTTTPLAALTPRELQLAPPAASPITSEGRTRPRGPTAAGDVANGALATSVFRRDGEYWTVVYRSATIRVRDTKGLRDLAVLLSQPGREVAAVDLAGAGAATAARAVNRGGEPRMTHESDVGAALDDEARRQYRTRLEDLEEEITSADLMNDPERAGRAREEREFLVAELGAAIGLGGRGRRMLDPAERARKAVTWRIRDAITRMEAANKGIGAHFRRSVRTGTFCVYDPPEPTAWTD